ncbi:MAG: ornithine carbamoyltransferase [Desulfobacterales bacterium]|nr:ornithine carbamoyltransferase [Desulfobacterales bacterium]
MKKDILSLMDLERDDFEHLFRRAVALKESRRAGIDEMPLRGKSLGLIFEKPSTRTRLSFEAAMVQLGGTPIFISARDLQMVRDEPVKDTARVLSRYLDGLVIRSFSQALVEEFAGYSTIPVVNALTDRYHPIQVLSDLMTVLEFKPDLAKQKIAWVGDGNNVAHSWINAAAVLDLDLRLACPEGYLPDRDILDDARDRGGRITMAADPADAVNGADVIYTDVWASMGQEEESEKRKRIFAPYQVNAALVALAAEDVIVMHCLPAHRGEEITENVLEGPQSVVWDQAENKLHMHKAVLEALMAPAAPHGA